MKKMIIIILMTILIVVSISYIFNRCSHAIVNDLYNNEIQSETTVEEPTIKDSGKRYPIEENPGHIFPDKYPIDAKFLEYVEKYQEEYRKYMGDPKTLMYEMCKKNGDWSKYPISDDVYNEYNEKDGLLGDIEYENIELVNKQIRFNGSYGDTAYDPAEILVVQGKKKTKYYIKYNSFDVLIKDIEVYTYYDSFITDENGNELEVGGPVTDLDILKLVVDKYDTKVGLSKKFKDKHPNFNGLIDIKKEANWDGNLKDMGYLVYVDNMASDFNNGVAVFEIDFGYAPGINEYRVDFKLDERGFLDEAKVTLLE